MLPAKSTDCKAWAGKCANGLLTTQTSRTQDNHCAKCDAGYRLDNKACKGWAGSCASGTLIQQSKRTQDDHCGKCATGYMLVSKVCKKTSSPTAAPSVSPTTKPTKSPTTAKPTRKPTSRAPTKEIAASWHVIEVEFPGIKFDELTGNRRRLQYKHSGGMNTKKKMTKQQFREMIKKEIAKQSHLDESDIKEIKLIRNKDGSVKVEVHLYHTTKFEKIEKASATLKKNGVKVLVNNNQQQGKSKQEDLTQNLCNGDFNGDEEVDASDLLDILGRFAALGTYKHGHAKGIGWHPQTPKYAKTTLEMCTGDLTLDQKLDTRDLLKLLQLYGSLFKKGTCGCCPDHSYNPKTYHLCDKTKN